MSTAAPDEIETRRLLLRRPRATDADAIFSRYASDPDVTRYLGWPRHRSVHDARTFLAYCDAEWARWGCGAYLILDKAQSRPAKAETGRSDAEGILRVTTAALLGSTGLSFESPARAMTGYVLATDAWGKGYATEALKAMIDLARALGVTYLYALCNAEHAPSQRVLEKGGLAREPELHHHEYPNLGPGLFDTLRYSINL